MERPVAVVTGGTSGIGLSTVKRFVEAGWEVVNLSRSPSDLAEAICVDLSDPSAFKTALIGLESRDISAVVHCAYSYAPTQTVLVGSEALSTLYRSLGPSLRRAGGALVALSTVYASDPMNAYALDKRHMEGWMQTYARGLAPEARANVVRTHHVCGTRNHPRETPEKARQLPLKRMGRAEEIAEVVYLAATNRYMTGAVLTVDGGWSLTRGEVS